MRTRLPLYALLASAATFLANLYLTWVGTVTPPPKFLGRGPKSLLDLLGGYSFNGWLSASLCLLLIALAWIERNGGLERLRVPDEIWRVDQLSGEN